MKIAIYFLMLFFATCSGSKKPTTGDSSEKAGTDTVVQTRDSDSRNRDADSQNGDDDARNQDNDAQNRDADAQKQDSIEQIRRVSVIEQALQNKKQDSVNDLSFVAGDAYSGVETSETLIVTEAKSLQKFYSRVNRTRKPGLPVPDIDFSKKMVIVRCSGTTDDGLPPELYVMEFKADSVVLGIREIEKSASASAVTTPFAVYTMSRTEKKISIRE